MKNDIIYETFVEALKKRGLKVKKQEKEDIYVVEVNGIEQAINLSNIRKEYERDKDISAVTYFFENVFIPSFDTPDWTSVKKRVMLKAEPSDFNFPDAIFEKVSDKFSKAAVYTNEDSSRISWIMKRYLKEWRISEKELFAAAMANMSEFLKDVEIEEADIDGTKVLLFLTDSPFKASLIFAPNLKEKVLKHISWPVLAVIPCRDFIYVFSEKDSQLINRLGGVVLKEYERCGYPITTEIIKIDDEGVSAIGKYESPESKMK